MTENHTENQGQTVEVMKFTINITPEVINVLKIYKEYIRKDPEGAKGGQSNGTTPSLFIPDFIYDFLTE